MSRGMAVCQKSFRLERLESDTSGFSASLDHDDLQDNSEELDVDRCDANLRGQYPFSSWSLTPPHTARFILIHFE